jgi:hypothetical protein
MIGCWISSGLSCRDDEQVKDRPTFPYYVIATESIYIVCVCTLKRVEGEVSGVDDQVIFSYPHITTKEYA